MKELLVADFSNPSVAVRVKVPAVVIVQPENVATPLDVACGFTQPPTGGGVTPATAIVTLLEPVVTVLPPASWTVTVTAGLIDAPASVFVGCAVKASLFAVPTVMSNAVLVAPVREPLVAERV